MLGEIDRLSRVLSDPPAVYDVGLPVNRLSGGEVGWNGGVGWLEQARSTPVSPARRGGLEGRGR